MTKTSLWFAAGLGLTLATAGYAITAPAPAASAAIDARKANFKEIGGAFKTINDEIKSGAPDINTVRPLARDLATRASLISRQFPRGSGPESGLKTRAKPEIWTDPPGFQKLQTDLVAAANNLNAAAATGDVAALISARAALGGVCKSCHERFRQAD